MMRFVVESGYDSLGRVFDLTLCGREDCVGISSLEEGSRRKQRADEALSGGIRPKRCCKGTIRNN